MTTTYIAWTGTNGKLNVQPVPTGQQATLGQTSNQGPALAFYNSLLYLAWTGTNGKLNVISSSDGINWENQVTLGQTSNNAPALIASSSLLSLVWTGTDGKLNLIFSSDGKNWINQITLNQTSALAPASAVGPFQDQALAWTGANGILNALFGMEIGMGQGAILNGTSNQGPALAFYQGLLYIAWTDARGNLNLASSSDGVHWTALPSSSQTSNNGPALTASSSLLSLAWAGTDTKLNVSSSADGRTWNTTTLNQTSKLAPAIAVGTF